MTDDLTHEIRRLETARRYGDIYATEFPRVLSPLARAGDFACFTPPDGAGQAVANGILHPDGNLRLHYDRINGQLSEAVDIVAAAERGRLPRQFNMTARRQMETPLPDRMHPDSIYQPSMRIYMCASEDGTRVVSHADTRSILNDAAPDLLDMVIDEDNIRAFMRRTEPLQDKFREAAIVLPANTLCVISGGTFHMRPDATRDNRVFFRACAFNAD